MSEDRKLLARAEEVVRAHQFASTSLLQRELGIGFGQAFRLMELLEAHRVVPSADGAKARAVLLPPLSACSACTPRIADQPIGGRDEHAQP